MLSDTTGGRVLQRTVYSDEFAWAIVGTCGQDSDFPSSIWIHRVLQFNSAVKYSNFAGNATSQADEGR